MPRVKRSVHARKKRRKVLDQAKGYWGLKTPTTRYAKEQVEHSLVYAYRDRKNKKRDFRRLWIIRINAAARANGLSYNQFIARLPQGGHRARPQGARRSRRQRSGRVRRDRRAGEGRARGQDSLRRLSDLARSSAGRRRTSRQPARRSTPGSPSAARRRSAPSTRLLATTSCWDMPLRLLGACTTSCSPGAEPNALSGRCGRRSGGARGARATSFARFVARARRPDERGAALPSLLPAFLSPREQVSRSTCSSSGRAPG